MKTKTSKPAVKKGKKAATDQFLLLHLKAGSKLSDKCLGARSREVKGEKIRRRCYSNCLPC